MNFIVGQKIRTRDRLWEISGSRSCPTGQILSLASLGAVEYSEIQVISSAEKIETISPQDMHWHIGVPVCMWDTMSLN